MILESSLQFKDGYIQLDADPNKNVITIDNIDYFMSYLTPDIKGNKGANSYIFTLTETQIDNEDELATPQKVIKISRNRDYYQNNKCKRHKKNDRFYRELFALSVCKKNKIKSVVEIDCRGHLACLNIKDHTKYYFPFYIMDYADSDLKNYLENNEIDLTERINLCLQVATGIKDLNNLGFYHRDIKPDNILVFNNSWKIGDLGLIAYRDVDNDDKNQFIGPKGWITPEAMNKYLSAGENNKGFDCKIDHQSDIFQLGKVFWYILQGNAPIGSFKRRDFIDKNDEIYALLKQMLSHAKSKRLKSIDEIITTLSRIVKKYYI